MGKNLNYCPISFYFKCINYISVLPVPFLARIFLGRRRHRIDLDSKRRGGVVNVEGHYFIIKVCQIVIVYMGEECSIEQITRVFNKYIHEQQRNTRLYTSG